MSVIALTGNRREDLGKGGARKSRAAGRIPGILYGHGETPIPVSVGARDFQLAMLQHKGGNAIVTLAVDGGEHTALIRDVQYDPITHSILHLDFQKVSLTETVEIEVAIHLTGLPTGVKDGGGVLEHITRTVKVRCLPTAIPAAFEVDCSALNIGESTHVRDIAVANVEILTDPDTTVATVVPPTIHEEKPAEEVAAEAVAAPEGAEPELSVERGKKEVEGAEAPPKKAEGKKEKE